MQDRTDYHIALAEVLLQQTKAERVASVFTALVREFPDWESVALAEIQTLERSLKPLGLYRRRAASLKALAGAVLAAGSLPDTVEELMKLPGMGQYISRMVALQRRTEVHVGAVDVNVARVLERVFGPRSMADVRYDPYLQGLALGLVPEGRELDYTLGILDFAASLCRARGPLCGACPVGRCRTRPVDAAA